MEAKDLPFVADTLKQILFGVVQFATVSLVNCNFHFQNQHSLFRSSLSFFSEVIDTIEMLEKDPEGTSVSIFLSMLLLQPLVQKGQSLELDIPLSSGSQQVTLTRSKNEDYEYLDHVSS